MSSMEISLPPFPAISETKRIRAIQGEHTLLASRRSEITSASISQITSFLESLAQAGTAISYPQYRSQLHALIRYWSGIVHDKTGSFPLLQLQPFDESNQLSTILEDITTTIDSIPQIKLRLERVELENQIKRQQLKQALQGTQPKESDDEKLEATSEVKSQQLQQLEIERQQLEIEKQRLDFLERSLKVRKRAIESALEIAYKMVDALRPDADKETKARLMQTLLPDLLQLGDHEGSESALPKLQSAKEKASTDE